MKKTLVTAALVALLASSAFADGALTLPQACYSNTDITSTLIRRDGDYCGTVNGKQVFTLIAVLDWPETLAVVNSFTNPSSTRTVAVRLKENDSSYSRAISLRSSSDGTKVVACYTADGVDQKGDDKGIEFVIQEKLVLTMVQSASGFSISAYDGNASTGSMLTLISKSDTVDASTINYDNLLVHSDIFPVDAVYVYNQVLEGDTLTAASKAAYGAAIPEPATATLSLLALAGLAARRRRK